MDKTPLVSIICNTYNHENFIRNAIDGFLCQQTDFPIEILIHDDASTDRTADIVCEYQKMHPHLIFAVYQRENQYSQGNHPNVFFQFPRARGKYIALCEGDDYWTDPLKLQKQFDFLEMNLDYVMCYHHYQIMKDGVIESGKRPKHRKDFSGDDLLATPGGIATATKFFRNIYTENLKNHPFILTDFPLNTYLGSFGSCKFLPAIAPTVRRLHSGGVWTSKDPNDQHLGYLKTKMQVYLFFSEQNDIHSMNVTLRALKDAISEKLIILEPNYKSFKMNFSYTRLEYRGLKLLFIYKPLIIALKSISKRIRGKS